MDIRHRRTGNTILSVQEDTLREADLREADLFEADLRGADLRGADLRGANLRGANLRGANLFEADLRGANLFEADLRGTDLRGADLRGANLRGADLRGANLRGANLFEADLFEADLREANLFGADLRGADLRGADLPKFCIVPEGTFTAWKKASGKLVQLTIPANAKRTSSLIGRKCRAEFVYTKAIFNLDGSPSSLLSVQGDYDNSTVYTIGKRTDPDKYCDDIRIECSNGIHFFITREEAINY